MADCDVAVVGAGVVGSSIARELAGRGASVTLVDARGAGLGATQAAAGMLAPYIEGFGRPILNMAARSLAMYDEFIERITRDSGVHVGYQRTGSLQAVMAGEPVDEINATAACAKHAGVRCTLLDGKQAREAEPLLAPDVAAALLIDDHGFVVPTELSDALLAASIKHGVSVRTPKRALRIARQNGGVEVQLESGPIRARHVVLAAGCWSGQLDVSGVSALPVRPVRGQLVHLASGGPALGRITWGSRCYLVPSAPGTVLVGATVEEAGFDERTTVAGVRDLLDAAGDLVPHLWQDTFAGARVGLRPATPDGLPIIGASTKVPGLVYATGHFRNGVLLAPLTARVVADLILENREDDVLQATSPQRFGESTWQSCPGRNRASAEDPARLDAGRPGHQEAIHVSGFSRRRGVCGQAGAGKRGRRSSSRHHDQLPPRDARLQHAQRRRVDAEGFRRRGDGRQACDSILRRTTARARSPPSRASRPGSCSGGMPGS